jgi:hypothetical protein
MLGFINNCNNVRKNYLTYPLQTFDVGKNYLFKVLLLHAVLSKSGNERKGKAI